MVHYAGYTPRFHPSDFATRTLDGVGADWPLRYPELRPYYEQIEQELPVAGERWPWGDPHGYPLPAAPGRRQRRDLPARRPRKLGIEAKVGPVAITNGRFGNRPHCIYRGLLPAGLQGERQGLAADHARTGRAGARRRGAGRRHGDPDRDRRGRPGGRWACTTSSDGRERFQRAAMVAVAGYSIETPRLLLNSACSRFPDGLCNDFDQVGRYLMVQGAPQTAGRFDAEVRMYKAPPPEVSTEQFYETDPARGLPARVLDPDRLAAAHHLGRARRGAGPLGRRPARVHERLRALGVPGRAVRVPAPAGKPGHAGRGEGPARPAGGGVLLLPVRQRQGPGQGGAGGHGGHPARAPAPTRSSPSSATPTWSAAPGWPRDERSGVVDQSCRTFAVPNLYITDGSVLPTQGAANPALTIMAVAARAADQLVAGARSGG